MVLIFFVILKFCVKQLTFFESTVLAASDFKNCRMVHCASEHERGMCIKRLFWPPYVVKK